MFSSHVEPEKNIPVTKKKPQSVFSKVTFIYIFYVSSQNVSMILKMYIF